jgi:hypothetical protein
VLAFGFGAVLGMSLDSVPAVDPAEAAVVNRAAEPPRRRRRRPADAVADEPLTAERATTTTEVPAAAQVTRERVPSE